MDVTVLGSGYVGLVTAACLSKIGHNVVCVDPNEQRIFWLQKGIVPFYEPGLESILNDPSCNISFVTKLPSTSVDIIIIAVGTPPLSDGSTNFLYINSAADNIANTITEKTLIVVKSTVPPGTCNKIKGYINNTLVERNQDFTIDVVSNPEFLREGNAIMDFMYPERILIGYEDKDSLDFILRMYSPLSKLQNHVGEINYILTNTTTSELSKYACNAMLATRISFVNELANLCDIIGASISDVTKVMGSDSRIGSKFLNAGCGYGGSCFSKDISSLINIGHQNGVSLDVISMTEFANKVQKSVLFCKINKHIPDLNDKIITLWGCAFKPNTDDMRDAPSITLIQQLLDNGALIRIHDPLAMETCQRIFNEDKHNAQITYFDDLVYSCEDSDCLVLVTEHESFNNTTQIIKEFDKMRTKIFIDGRNMFTQHKSQLMNYVDVYENIGDNI